MQLFGDKLLKGIRRLYVNRLFATKDGVSLWDDPQDTPDANGRKVKASTTL